MTQRKKRPRPNEKIGLWIQCCGENCKKWRFVKEYQDPMSVPEKWFCSENLDKKFASCDIPEEKIDDELVESKYVPGNIVWAKMTGYPWWPAIIDNCPETNTFYELGATDIPLRYHVTFFGEGKVLCAWMKAEKIKPFKEVDGNRPKKARNCYSEPLSKSLEIAKSAINLDNDERLKKYSFPQLYDDSAKSNEIQKRRKENVKYISSDISQNELKQEAKCAIKTREDSPENGKIINSDSIFETNHSLMSLINLPRQICTIQ